MGLDLKAYLEQYHEICKRYYGRDYDFSAIEKGFAPLREGQGWLTPQHVSRVFHPDNTPFRKYWPKPSKDDLDKLSAARLSLKLNPKDRGDLVRRLLSIFHNTGVTSLILRCVHPDCFGVFSTPVLHLLQVNHSSTVELYLAYCDELSEWKSHFRLSSVADTEMAITSLAEIIKGVDNDKKAKDAKRSFEEDVWVQRRRARNILRPFLNTFGPLQLARILLDEYPKLAGMIAGAEYERLLGVASQRFLGRRLTAKKGAAEQLIAELEQKQKISLPETVELRGVWKTRNAAVHPGGLPPTRAAVEVMIDRIETICSGWEGDMGKASGNPR